MHLYVTKLKMWLCSSGVVLTCLHSTLLDTPSQITFLVEFQAIILFSLTYMLCFQTQYYLSAYKISSHVLVPSTDISHHGNGHNSSFTQAAEAWAGKLWFPIIYFFK
jgi:hypothetical protein